MPPRRRPAVHVDGLLAIDKPAGMTSFDVVRAIRRLSGQRRAGHAGTLDPDATGVLLVCLGEATKCVPYLMSSQKRYEAEVVLGSETTTDDAEGEITRRAAIPQLSRESVERALGAFVGTISQVPPAVSALKTDGVPDHERVRKGEIVERSGRAVVCHAITLLDLAADRLRLDVLCGPGFYVRSLARDLGRALGSVAHVGSLRRTAAGGYAIDDDTVRLEDLGAADLRSRLVPVARAVRTLPVVQVDETMARRLRDGLDQAAPPGVAEGIAALHFGDVLLGFGVISTGRVKLRRGFGEAIEKPAEIEGDAPADAGQGAA